MFNKRRQKKAQERNDLRADIERQFSNDIRRAERVGDPAERIIELHNISARIIDHLSASQAEMEKKSYKSYLKTGLGGGMSSIVGGTAAACALTGPIGLVVFGAGAAAGLSAPFIGLLRERSVRRKHEQETASHRDKMEDMLILIDDTANTIIEDNLKEISKSPLYGDVRALPGLTEKFADAAAKHLSADEAPAVEKAATPAPVKKDAVPPAKRELSDYSTIKGAIKSLSKRRSS